MTRIKWTKKDLVAKWQQEMRILNKPVVPPEQLLDRALGTVPGAGLPGEPMGMEGEVPAGLPPMPAGLPPMPG